MSNIESRVIAIVSEQLDEDIKTIKPESSFSNDLGADSLDVVELIMALEEEFEVEINDDEAEKLQTVKSVVEYIEANIGQ